MSEENYLHCSIKLGETTVTFFLEPLKKYQNKQDSQFVGSFVKIENRFVHIESTPAIFEYPNVLELRDWMDQAINGKLTEGQYIGFAEPDILFIYPELAENEEPYIEMRLYLHLSEYTGEYYSLMIEVPKLVQFRYFLDYCLNANDNHKTWYTASGRPISYRYYNKAHQENPELHQKLDKLFTACLIAWDELTTLPVCREDASFDLAVDPSYGQCAVTAMLVRELVGGDVYRIRTESGMTHYFNLIEGTLVDFTIDQFRLYNLHVSYKNAEFMPENFEKLNQNTQYRYQRLKNKVLKHLEENK